MNLTNPLGAFQCKSHCISFYYATHIQAGRRYKLNNERSDNLAPKNEQQESLQQEKKNKKKKRLLWSKVNVDL